MLPRCLIVTHFDFHMTYGLSHLFQFLSRHVSAAFVRYVDKRRQFGQSGILLARSMGTEWGSHKGGTSPIAVKSVSEFERVTGERGRIRTCDPCLKRALLYHLSYAPTIFQI
jgi:hypothetical protein